MSDALAANLASDAPLAEPAAAPALAAPEPATAAPEPSRRETISAAVEAQKERAATDGDRPAKAVAPGSGQARAPDGKFVPSTDRPAPDRTAAPATAAPAAAPPAADPAEAPRAPGTFSPAAKVAFDSAPPALKEAVAKREAEYAKGLERYHALKPVEKYAEMAARGGTTLDRALENYVGIEQLLNRDPIAAFEQIMRNVRIDPQSFATAYLHRVSQGGQNARPNAPQGGQNAGNTSQGGQNAGQLDPQAIVRQATEAVRAEYEARQIQSDVQKFASDPKNRFYENVRQEMSRLVQAGIANDIQSAYDKACRMDPEISRLLNQPPAPDPRKIAADQARGHARATTGAPASGQGPRPPGLPANATRRQVIEASVARQKDARA
jgi:hypothetical protein